MNENDISLPVRTGPDVVEVLVDNLSLGYDLTKIEQIHDWGAMGFRGVQHASEVLGFYNGDAGELTTEGWQFAENPETRQRAMLKAIVSYEPYGLFLARLTNGSNGSTTSLDEYLRWLTSHKHGTSQTNRKEGVYAFVKFVEYCQLGSYVRGSNARIEWADDAPDRIRSAQIRDEEPVENRDDTDRYSEMKVLDRSSENPESILDSQLPAQSGVSFAKAPGSVHTFAVSQPQNLENRTVAYFEQSYPIGDGGFLMIKLPTPLSTMERAAIKTYLGIVGSLVDAMPGAVEVNAQRGNSHEESIEVIGSEDE